VSVTARECIGAAKCPYGQECFAERARDRAAGVDVVVTNHALLAIDAADGIPVLPEHDAVVVDEAHELVARVTGVATQELAPAAVERAARRLGSRIVADEADVAGALADAAADVREALAGTPAGRLAPPPEPVRTAVAAVRDAARGALSALAADRAARAAGAEAAHRQAKAGLEELFTTAERVLAAAATAPAGSGPDVLWLEQTDRFGRLLKIAPLSVAELLAAGLFARRTAVLTSATLRLGGSFDAVARGVGLPTPGEAGDAAAAKASAAVETSDAAGAGDAAGARDAAGAAVVAGGAGRAADAAGAAASISDAAAAAVTVSDAAAAAVETSDAACDTAGGAAVAASRAAWVGLDVGSPFDYPRQGILYVARHLPPPGRDGPSAALLDELTALVLAAGGRTLGLFSSRRAAEVAAEHVRHRLATPDPPATGWPGGPGDGAAGGVEHVGRLADVEVLCQGDDLVPTLIRQFAAEPRSCLFGTLSLWQGVDVPGPACQLVVLDRLPFPRPDDPLSTARSRAVDAAGGNGFLAVSVAHAALLLAQGSGRLIRRSTDRGVVAVLDSRLATARYAGYLRASLPPLWPTTDRAVVLGALARLDAAAAPAPA
jgi:ATP-dependent DNA helicase DinG